MTEVVEVFQQDQGPGALQGWWLDTSLVFTLLITSSRVSQGPGRGESSGEDEGTGVGRVTGMEELLQRVTDPRVEELREVDIRSIHLRDTEDESK